LESKEGKGMAEDGGRRKGMAEEEGGGKMRDRRRVVERRKGRDTSEGLLQKLIRPRPP
jgi:hypothetical protein